MPNGGHTRSTSVYCSLVLLLNVISITGSSVNGLSREPMPSYCQLNPKGYISVKLPSKYATFHWRNCVWKCRLQNGGDWLCSVGWICVQICIICHQVIAWFLLFQIMSRGRICWKRKPVCDLPAAKCEHHTEQIFSLDTRGNITYGKWQQTLLWASYVIVIELSKPTCIYGCDCEIWTRSTLCLSIC